MTRFSAAALALACSTLAMAPARAAQPFDGQWSVEVITEKGTCDSAYRWDLAIANGQIAAVQGMPAGASGSISPKGLVRANFTRGSDRMVASGSASGKWATGQWTAASLQCSGRWRAERRA